MKEVIEQVVETWQHAHRVPARRPPRCWRAFPTGALASVVEHSPRKACLMLDECCVRGPPLVGVRACDAPVLRNQEERCDGWSDVSNAVGGQKKHLIDREEGTT